jgi:hypothetical protein
MRQASYPQLGCKAVRPFLVRFLAVIISSQGYYSGVYLIVGGYMAELVREEPVRERVVDRDVVATDSNYGGLIAAIVIVALIIILLLWRPWHNSGSNGSGGSVNVSPTQTQSTPSGTSSGTTSGSTTPSGSSSSTSSSSNTSQ